MGADEKTLREAKDAMVGGLASLPGRTVSMDAIETIVEPILHKMERAEETPDVREGFKQNPIEEDDDLQLERFKKDSAGNARAFAREATAQEIAQAKKRRNPLDIRVQVQDAIRELMTLPEWKARLYKIASSNMSRDEKGKAYEKVLADAVRVFGDIAPIEKEKKIIVGAS